jgi:transposase
VKAFRAWNVDQVWLLPPSVQELVPADDPAHMVRDLVRKEMDLEAILSTYSEERGYPPYHPTMMTALLLYAYAQGVYSSRRIARACQRRVDFMAVTAMQKPDFRTISDFRKRHLEALGGLFQQVLRLCARAGMVKLGHVALDGTKVLANASKRKAMSYEHMKKKEIELAAKVAEWFARAQAEDEAEDREHGVDRRGDEMPDWVRDKQKRLEKIRAAKAELEAEAKQQIEAEAAAKVKAPEDDDNPPPGKPWGGRKRPKKNGEPHDKAQLNFTDPDSRIMKGPSGFVQAYNCQAAVDVTAQIIVAHATNNVQNDGAQLIPMVAQIKKNLGRQPAELSADSGYLSEENLAALARTRIRGYIATGRIAHSAAAPNRRNPSGPRTLAMRRKLDQGGRRSRYRLRKQTVEPVFGQIKEARGFRRFLLRGLPLVPHEWALICTAHNLAKLSRRVA